MMTFFLNSITSLSNKYRINHISCVRIGDTMNVSHDSVNRFMHREDYTPKDLFDESTKDINLNGGTVSVDDMVIDKPYANYIYYIGYFYSGKHHRVVQGINLITLINLM